ncbi:MAG: (2Fe-2S)-binding protein [Chloroflexi bacterium RBG_13_57_8]|nr:MAG: (2Fe-2S)-binding protein [Chloroflexi bacterium RBG_13_57_8]
MGSYVEIARTGDLRDGEKKKVAVKGLEIMLARVGGNYYGIGNRCAHMGGDLSMGTLEGKIITCPRHGSQYDVTDGHNVRWMRGTGLAAAIGKVIKPPRPVPAYRVKIEGDAVLAEI